jgi:hypothetical protein
MTGSLSRMRDGWGRTRLLLSVVAVMTLAFTSIVMSAGSAKASYPSTGYGVGDCTGAGTGCVIGNFIWYNRSVQVGGTLWAGIDGETGDAVVYTAYSGSGKILARAVRPGDGQYLYAGKLGHGFTLDASTVAGGIQKVEVAIWNHNRFTGQTWECCWATWLRP